MAVHKKYAKNVLGRGLDDIGNGRGLDALISTGDVHTDGSSALGEVPVAQIHPNADQPRRDFDEAALEDLAQSIRSIGIVQPVTLRKTGDNSYELIAGERRWRAAQLAGLTSIPAYIRTVEDENVMEMALVENIQREDLNAIEIALAYEHLADNSNLTQEELAKRVGQSRSNVANYMRLLKLPAQVQMALKNREIEMGHARALLALESPTMQVKLFKEMLKFQYSVRKVEDMVRLLNAGDSNISDARRRVKAPAKLDDHFAAMRDNLAGRLGAKVQLAISDKGRGKLSIAFGSKSELERIIAALGAQTAEETNNEGE